MEPKGVLFPGASLCKKGPRTLFIYICKSFLLACGLFAFSSFYIFFLAQLFLSKAKELGGGWEEKEEFLFVDRVYADIYR